MEGDEGGLVGIVVVSSYGVGWGGGLGMGWGCRYGSV